MTSVRNRFVREAQEMLKKETSRVGSSSSYSVNVVGGGKLGNKSILKKAAPRKKLRFEDEKKDANKGLTSMLLGNTEELENFSKRLKSATMMVNAVTKGLEDLKKSDNEVRKAMNALGVDPNIDSSDFAGYILTKLAEKEEKKVPELNKLKDEWYYKVAEAGPDDTYEKAVKMCGTPLSRTMFQCCNRDDKEWHRIKFGSKGSFCMGEVGKKFGNKETFYKLGSQARVLEEKNEEEDKGEGTGLIAEVDDELKNEEKDKGEGTGLIAGVEDELKNEELESLGDSERESTNVSEEWRQFEEAREEGISKRGPPTPGKRRKSRRNPPRSARQKKQREIRYVRKNQEEMRLKCLKHRNNKDSCNKQKDCRFWKRKGGRKDECLPLRKYYLP